VEPAYAVLLDPEQHIEEVFLLVVSTSNSPLLVLLDGVVHELGRLVVTRRVLTFTGLVGPSSADSKLAIEDQSV
jgi:hypothetical protein